MKIFIHYTKKRLLGIEPIILRKEESEKRIWSRDHKIVITWNRRRKTYKSPDLIIAKRSRMKIILFEPNKVLPLNTMKQFFKMHYI